LLPTNLDKGLACWTLMLGRNLQDSAILSRKRTSQGFEMIAGWIIIFCLFFQQRPAILR
jgi:hypothetical protein